MKLDARRKPAPVPHHLTDPPSSRLRAIIAELEQREDFNAQAALVPLKIALKFLEPTPDSLPEVKP